MKTTFKLISTSFLALVVLFTIALTIVPDNPIVLQVQTAVNSDAMVTATQVMSAAFIVVAILTLLSLSILSGNPPLYFRNFARAMKREMSTYVEVGWRNKLNT